MVQIKMPFGLKCILLLVGFLLLYTSGQGKRVDSEAFYLENHISVAPWELEQTIKNTDSQHQLSLTQLPTHDKDGDGVVDSLDECPLIAGLASMYGCPDRDEDGISDQEDKCPDSAGPADQQGCPEIRPEEKYKMVYFSTASTALNARALRVIADLVKVLKEDRGIFVEVEGHADTKGPINVNKKLSERRASVVRNYLIKCGLSPNRISSRGYGSEKPRANNETPEGRAKNRRTEIHLRK